MSRCYYYRIRKGDKYSQGSYYKGIRWGKRGRIWKRRSDLTSHLNSIGASSRAEYADAVIEVVEVVPVSAFPASDWEKHFLRNSICSAHKSYDPSCNLCKEL